MNDKWAEILGKVGSAAAESGGKAAKTYLIMKYGIIGVSVIVVLLFSWFLISVFTLSDSEKLEQCQSQLHERDIEIALLRQ